mgnify:CR=1 FL=1
MRVFEISYENSECESLDDLKVWYVGGKWEPGVGGGVFVGGGLCGEQGGEGGGGVLIISFGLPKIVNR